jgi:hypothetical protein
MCLRCSERSGAFDESDPGYFSEASKRRSGEEIEPPPSLLANLSAEGGMRGVVSLAG